jgi:hypothetical protein
MVGLLPDVSLAALDMTTVARAVQATADDLGEVELQARTGRPNGPRGDWDVALQHPARPPDVGIFGGRRSSSRGATDPRHR